MKKIRLIASIILLIIVSVFCTIVIVVVPNFFSAEYFAKVFPEGGLVHSMMGAFLISVVLGLICFFSRRSILKELSILALTTSAFVIIYQGFLAALQYFSTAVPLITNEEAFFSRLISLTVTIIGALGYGILGIFLSLFGILYYFVVISLLFVIVYLIRRFILRDFKVE